jgi:transposase
MARYKENNREQALLLPVHYQHQILPGTIEYAIDDIVDNYIDTSYFNTRYSNDSCGAKAYLPSVLLKIILLAYAKGCTTSRKIQDLCETNVLFIAISANSKPDHSTISAFISSMKGEIIGIFSDILIRCAQLDLIGGEVFALDGCKMSSNASKEMSGTIQEFTKKKEKLKAMCTAMIESHAKNDSIDEQDSLEKRTEKYRKKIEKIEAFLETAEPRKGKRSGENKSNITDNESAKMKSSHGVIQGYNGLAVVDDKNQIIIKAEAFGQGHEGDLLPGLIEKTKENMQSIDKGWTFENTKVIADTNYFSETNCEYLVKKEIDGYIPDVHFRKRDPRFPGDYPHRKEERKNLFGHDKFFYNAMNNSFSCPAGKELKYDGVSNNHGHIGRRYKVKDGSCSVCYMKNECMKKNSKIRSIFITDIPKSKTFSESMIEKIDSLYGRKIYSLRMGIVEPVFANIRYCKGLDRFTLRGKEKVNIQWMLYCCIHNIEKTLKAAA